MWLTKRSAQSRSWPMTCVAQLLLGASVALVVLAGCLMVSSYIHRMTLEATLQIVDVVSRESAARINGAVETSTAIAAEFAQSQSVTKCLATATTRASSIVVNEEEKEEGMRRGHRVELDIVSSLSTCLLTAAWAVAQRSPLPLFSRMSQCLHAPSGLGHQLRSNETTVYNRSVAFTLSSEVFSASAARRAAVLQRSFPFSGTSRSVFLAETPTPPSSSSAEPSATTASILSVPMDSPDVVSTSITTTSATPPPAAASPQPLPLVWYQDAYRITTMATASTADADTAAMSLISSQRLASTSSSGPLGVWWPDCLPWSNPQKIRPLSSPSSSATRKTTPLVNSYVSRAASSSKARIFASWLDDAHQQGDAANSGRSSGTAARDLYIRFSPGSTPTQAMLTLAFIVPPLTSFSSTAASAVPSFTNQTTFTFNVSDSMWTPRRSTLYDVVELVVDRSANDAIVMSSVDPIGHRGLTLSVLLASKFPPNVIHRRSRLPATTSLDLIVILSVDQLEERAAKNPTRLVILVVLGIGVFVAVSSALAVRISTRSLVHLAKDMVNLGRLDFDRFDHGKHASLIVETQYIAAGFQRLLELAVAVKMQLPNGQGGGIDNEDGETLAASSFASTIDASLLGGSLSGDKGGGGGGDDLAAQLSVSWEHTRTVTIELTYEDAVSSEFIGDARFQFVFPDVEPRLLERLIRECKEAVDEDPFEPVTLESVDGAGAQVLLRHSMQLHEALSAGPTSMTLVMLRTSNRSKGAFLAAALDLINAAVTVVFSVQVVKEQETSTSIPFVAFFFTALLLNTAIGIGLLRSNKAEGFTEWLERSSTEVALALTCCAPNTMNLAVLWSNVKVSRFLRFNAPVQEKIKRQSISMSVFGFLFSDVAQLLYKIWIVYSSTTTQLLNVLALTTGGISVLFNLLIKVHAMFLMAGVNPSGGGASSDTSGPETSSNADELAMRDVSFVRCQFSAPDFVLQLQLRTIEYNNFYNLAINIARKYQGVPLLLHGGDVLIAFNAHRRAPHHALDAIAFASALTRQSQRAKHIVNCVVATSPCLTGLLGTTTHKALHCLGPMSSLSRMCDVAAVTGIGVLVLGSTLRHMECDGLPSPIPIMCPAEFLAPPSIRCFISSCSTLFRPVLSVIEQQAEGNSPIDPAEHPWIDEQLCGVLHDAAALPTSSLATATSSSLRVAQFAEGCGLAFEPRDVIVDRAKRIAALLQRAREFAAAGGLVATSDSASAQFRVFSPSKFLVL